jgi:aspartate aminotransferase-like enzyme
MILLSPGPANTTQTVKHAMTRPDICPREREFGAVLAWVRDAITRVVHPGTAYTTVLLGGSGTAGVEPAISSSVPADGRLLIIDNGAYGARMAQIAEAYLGFRRLLPEAILSRILTCYLEPDHPRYAFSEMHDRLYDKGFTIYPGKCARQATFRLANMGNLRTDDMRAFLAAMSQTIEEMGMSPLYSS